MWSVVGVFAAGCLGALIAGIVVVAASWRELMKEWEDE